MLVGSPQADVFAWETKDRTHFTKLIHVTCASLEVVDLVTAAEDYVCQVWFVSTASSLFVWFYLVDFHLSTALCLPCPYAVWCNCCSA